MIINEIFTSIQGEGSWIGRRVTFIRLQGCSLHCPWCDSASTWSKQGFCVSIEDAVRQVDTQAVVITGGEPTEQEAELKMLIKELKQRGHEVALESNGTCEHYAELGADWVVVSPKPGAMYCVFTEGVNELKYVVTKEFNDAVAIPNTIRAKFDGHIWLQPCDYANDEEATKQMYKKAMELVAKDSRLRCGIQLHKIYNVR